MVPALATAIVNHRIHPSQSVADVVEFDRKVIDDPRVKLKVLTKREPMPVSPHGPDDLNYQLISTTIRQTYDNVPVVPGISLIYII